MEEIKTGVIFFIGCFVLFLFFISGLPTDDSKNPVITLEYAPNIDRFLCTTYGKSKITPEWGKEFARKYPRLENAWSRTGPLLISKASEITGKNFLFDDKKVYLFMCPTLSAFAIPLMIPMHSYVQGQNTPLNDVEFIDTIFHQVLHMYVLGAIFPNYISAKISQHFHENWKVLTHLHLFALQKSVYLNTNRQFLWFQLKERTKDPDLLRAIEIVETTGTQAFIDELK